MELNFFVEEHQSLLITVLCFSRRFTVVQYLDYNEKLPSPHVHTCTLIMLLFTGQRLIIILPLRFLLCRLCLEYSFLPMFQIWILTLITRFFNLSLLILLNMNLFREKIKFVLKGTSMFSQVSSF